MFESLPMHRSFSQLDPLYLLTVGKRQPLRGNCLHTPGWQLNGWTGRGFWNYFSLPLQDRWSICIGKFVCVVAMVDSGSAMQFPRSRICDCKPSHPRFAFGTQARCTCSTLQVDPAHAKSKWGEELLDIYIYFELGVKSLMGNLFIWREYQLQWSMLWRHCLVVLLISVDPFRAVQAPVRPGPCGYHVVPAYTEIQAPLGGPQITQIRALKNMQLCSVLRASLQRTAWGFLSCQGRKKSCGCQVVVFTSFGMRGARNQNVPKAQAMQVIALQYSWPFRSWLKKVQAVNNEYETRGRCA